MGGHVGSGTRVEVPISGLLRLLQGHGAEGRRKGLLIPARQPGEWIIESRRRGSPLASMFRGGDRRGKLPERRLHQERLLWCLLVRARWKRSERRPCHGPHLNGTGPRVVVGGPRGALVAGLLAGGLAARGLPAMLLLLLSGAAAARRLLDEEEAGPPLESVPPGRTDWEGAVGVEPEAASAVA